MIREKTEKQIVIDLTGPQGNAFYLLGAAKNFAKQLNYSKEETEKLLSDMKSSDYENLLKVFDDNFGSFVILER
jgi:hypothetical protein